MPAIFPARLKQQAALLADHFDDPAAFVRSLHHLLEAYSNRAYRPGQAGELPPLLETYRVQPPVLRQLLLAIAPLANESPASGLALSDALWEQPNLEFRLLAAMLLGQIPCSPSEPILNRLNAWIKPDMELRVLEVLFTSGLASCQQHQPQVILELAEEWLKHDESFYNQLGLRLILPFAENPDFDNLPALFRLIQPYCRKITPQLRPEILDVAIILARRSPIETTYFLRQTFEMPESKDTPWLIRQCLSEFPPQQQENLRQMLRQGIER